jgi:hypothetical protein
MSAAPEKKRYRFEDDVTDVIFSRVVRMYREAIMEDDLEAVATLYESAGVNVQRVMDGDSAEFEKFRSFLHVFSSLFPVLHEKAEGAFPLARQVTICYLDYLNTFVSMMEEGGVTMSEAGDEPVFPESSKDPASEKRLKDYSKAKETLETALADLMAELDKDGGLLAVRGHFRSKGIPSVFFDKIITTGLKHMILAVWTDARAVIEVEGQDETARLLSGAPEDLEREHKRREAKQALDTIKPFQFVAPKGPTKLLH